MAKKLCIICGRRNATSANGPDMNDMCDPCYTEAGWENTHSDGGHDEINAGTYVNADEKIYMDNCWICHPELNKALAEVKTGHTNTVAKSYHSHAKCTHPTTPKARAACRKAGGPKA
jgi:hypothetical protein